MTFLISLIWLQSRPLSKTVIAIASLLFILAIVLVVYFVRKLRQSNKTEDDWSLTRSSLFVEHTQEPPPAEALPEAAEPEPPEPPRAEEFVAPKIESTPSATELLTATEPEPPIRDERHTQVFSSPPPPLREERKTEVLSSYRPEPVPTPEEIVPATPPVTDTASDEALPFDEEVWAGIEEVEPPAAEEGTRELRSPAAPFIAPHAELDSPVIDEPTHTARVEQHPPRALFEPPVVEPMRPSREPFEPPVITPVTPREQTALLGTRQADAPAKRDFVSPEIPPRPPVDRPAAERDLYNEPPRPTAPLYSEPNEPAGGQLWDAATLAQATRAGSASKPVGNVLGLPMEMSHAPLVLGTPAKSREEIGIGSLTGYGRVDKDGGRGGLIALAIALLLFGGAALAYFFVPSVHERVNGWVARQRGLEPADSLLTQAKATIYPSRTPDTDKNTVHAKGAVQNISTDTLENLTLEVQLNKTGGEVEMLNIPVTPAQLAPNDQGTYAFDYEAKGVTSYTIKRLFIDGKEARFNAPGMK